jgi:hypothetical protein
MDTFDLKKYLAENPLMKENENGEEEPQIKYGIFENWGKYYSTVNEKLPTIVFTENTLVELEWFSDDNYEIVDYILTGEVIATDEEDQQIFEENLEDYDQAKNQGRDLVEVFDTEEEAMEVFEEKYHYSPYN